MGILLDAIYAAGLVATSPVWTYRMIRHGRYRQRVGQRFGAVPVRHSRQPAIWVHGVSLGEVNAARTLVQKLHSQLPDFQVVISSTTDTGMAAAQRRYAPEHLVFQWPLDFTLSVRKALDRIRPSLVVLMEGEAWPNFLAACNARKIPTAVVNGRLSADKGYPRYRKLGPLAARLFNRLSAVCVQDDSYARRFRELGIAPEKIRVTGMMKFDTAEVADRIDGQDELAAALGIDDDQQLLVAGGTGPGEEQMLLEIFNRLRKEHPEIRLAIVPRKPERFEEVARLIKQSGLAFLRRSERPDGTEDDAGAASVILGDTMGELRKFYALASVCFVGRSLVPMGGSDMIEAAALGRPTVFGRHTYNFPQAGELAENGCVQVDGPVELAEQIERWLADPPAAAEAGKRAQQAVIERQGATRRNVEVLCGLLGRQPARRPGGIATDRVEAEQ
ncbi:MAG: 3-deoxy-D-manno-octulosonic acid transferase [Planctomycetota bacterium]